VSAVYVALGVVGLVGLVALIVWLGMRASRQLGEAEGEKGTSERVAERAEQASGVAADIRALPDGDALKRLRSDWSRH
jgi:hypothetical protein